MRQRSQRRPLQPGVVEHDAGGQQRADQARPKLAQRKSASQRQRHAQHQQQPAGRRADGERTRPEGSRPLGPLLAVELDDRRRR